MGAAAKLRSLPLLLTREIGVSVHLAMEPENCVIKGAAMALENLDIYRRAVK